MSVKDEYCLRCGNCCEGMQWKKKFGFQEAFEIAGNKSSRAEINNSLMSYFKLYLKNNGLTIKKSYPVEWDYRRKEIILRAIVNRCKNLMFEKEK